MESSEPDFTAFREVLERELEAMPTDDIYRLLESAEAYRRELEAKPPNPAAALEVTGYAIMDEMGRMELIRRGMSPVFIGEKGAHDD